MSAKKIVTIALLIALEIVLTRFVSIQTPIVRIGFGFLPIAMIGMMFGPLFGGLAAAMADVMGFFLFPPPFPFYPGFTLTAALSGATYGFFLHKKDHSLLRICIAVPIVTLIWGLGLNTVWLMHITGQGFMWLLPPRIAAALIMTPLQIIFIKAAAKALKTAKPHLGLDFD